jgi:hypothetical protein
VSYLTRVGIIDPHPLDAVFLVCRDLASEWVPPIKSEMRYGDVERPAFARAGQNEPAHDAACICCVADVHDLALPGHIIVRSLVSEKGREVGRQRRPQWQRCFELGEQACDLLEIVD